MSRVLFALILASAALAQQDATSRAMNEPVEPFRIAGNLYYVGASDVTSFLFTTREGHILIDGGFEETAPQIASNIEKLGFRIRDVRLLLNTHGHYDHAGGLRELKRLTGARFLAHRREIPLLARGGRDDPQFGERFPYRGIHADGIVEDGGRVRLGGTELVAHLTAGHTRGCTTWTTTVREGKSTWSVVILCSPTAPSQYQLVGNNKYPDAVADYRAQFAFLRSLKPDIFLGSHGGFFQLQEKITELKAGAPRNPFVDRDGYQRLVALMEERFEAMAAKQSAVFAQTYIVPQTPSCICRNKDSR